MATVWAQASEQSRRVNHHLAPHSSCQHRQPTCFGTYTYLNTQTRGTTSAGNTLRISDYFSCYYTWSSRTKCFHSRAQAGHIIRCIFKYLQLQDNKSYLDGVLDMNITVYLSKLFSTMYHCSLFFCHSRFRNVINNSGLIFNNVCPFLSVSFANFPYFLTSTVVCISLQTD